jgi:hypothetical protein
MMDAQSLFSLPIANPKHPAKYTDALLSAFVKMLQGCKRVLDPFGGTGKVFLLNHWYPEMEIQAVEIEPEWAAINPRTIVGSALSLPYASNYFDAVCTSPTYGNAMAKQHNLENLAKKNWRVFTYKSLLGRNLHKENSGRLLWGDGYRNFHISAWLEARRTIVDRGVLVLNIKNHILDGKEILVTEWHIETLQRLGFVLLEHQRIKTPSLRWGRGQDNRIGYESVVRFMKVSP